MSRPQVRTATLNMDVVRASLRLFGTVTNAHRQLGLTELIKYPVFYRAMHVLEIRPRDKELIENAWDVWRETYLRPEVPIGSDLEVQPDQALPSWHPNHMPIPKRNGIKPHKIGAKS